MPASIFGERFLGYRQPAWHGLGQVFTESIGAVAGFKRIGEYTVRLEDLYTDKADIVPKRGIFRDPTVDDPQTRLFGFTKLDYTLLSPQSFCEIWDKTVSQSLETMGALGHGEVMFLTVKLPSFSVNGDDVDNYMLAVNDMTGSEKLIINITPVRVVCQNTLIMAKGQATLKYKLPHDAAIRERLFSILLHVYNETLVKAEQTKAIFAALSNKRVAPEEVEMVLIYSYPLPVLKENPTQDDVTHYESVKEAIIARKLAAKDLFQGKGTGMGLVAASGTAWGLYNSIVELECFREGRNDSTISKGILFGGRAAVMARAYSFVLELI